MLIKKIVKFYIDGFKNMKLGRTLWLIIAIKLFVMFFILKVFFFNHTLDTKFNNDKDKINFIYKNIVKEVK